MKELLLGCGHRRAKDVITPAGKEFQNLTTLDMYEECKPDIVFDLSRLNFKEQGRLPFNDNEFDEAHVYDCLEHFNAQGDFRSFCWEFREYWRVLKPDGLFCATVPRYDSDHAWGDPGHTRVINELSLVYLSKKEVEKQLGVTTLADYRRYTGNMDFECVHLQKGQERLAFVLKAIKPN